MVRRKTGEIEGVGETEYQRLYIPSALRVDSAYPFEAGDGVRLQLVETTCGREVLVVTSDTLEVETETTAIGLTRSSTELQTGLDDVVPGGSP